MNYKFNYLTAPIVNDTYNTDNFIVKKLAVIYCSSNGIYFPNEYEIFKKYMIDKNRFKWTKNKWNIECAGLNIYLILVK